MRLWGDSARQFYNQIFSTKNIPRKTFRWKNIGKDPESLKSVINQFDPQFISLVSEGVNVALKVGVPGAYGLGFLVLSSYLSGCGVPLVISDFSTTLWLITVAALLAFFAIVLMALIFWLPAFIFPMSSTLFRNTRTTLGYHKQPKEFVIEWLANNGISLAMLVFIILAFFINLPGIAFISSILLLWIVSSTVTVYLILRYSIRYQRFLLKSRFDLCAQVLWRVWRFASWKAFWAVLWVAVVAAVFSRLMGGTIWPIAFIIMYLYVIYFVSSTVIGGIRYRILMFMMVCAIFLISVFPSYSGKMALQFLRIGGGIPVSILSKTMIPGGKDVVAHTIVGCMILNAGSHIIIKVLDHPTLDTCQLELSPSRVNIGEMLKGIEIISGSDVVNLGPP